MVDKQENDIEERDQYQLKPPGLQDVAKLAKQSTLGSFHGKSDIDSFSIVELPEEENSSSSDKQNRLSKTHSIISFFSSVESANGSRHNLDTIDDDPNNDMLGVKRAHAIRRPPRSPNPQKKNNTCGREPSFEDETVG